MKMSMKILSVTVLSLAVVGGAHAKEKIASRLKTPHPRATDARLRGIKFPISDDGRLWPYHYRSRKKR